MSDFFIVEPCTTSGGFEIKLQGKKIDLKLAESEISKIGEVIANSPVVLLAKIDDYSVSFYASGRMMVKSDKKMKQETIDKLAKKIIDGLTSGGVI